MLLQPHICIPGPSPKHTLGCRLLNMWNSRDPPCATDVLRAAASWCDPSGKPRPSHKRPAGVLVPGSQPPASTPPSCTGCELLHGRDLPHCACSVYTAGSQLLSYRMWRDSSPFPTPASLSLTPPPSYYCYLYSSLFQKDLRLL